jgi:hypothetical protein
MPCERFVRRAAGASGVFSGCAVEEVRILQPANWLSTPLNSKVQLVGLADRFKRRRRLKNCAFYSHTDGCQRVVMTS